MGRYDHLMHTPEQLISLLEMRDRQDAVKFGLHWEKDPGGENSAANIKRAGEVALLTTEPGLAIGNPSSGNLLIEGDNRDGLEALRRTHAGRIRAVLIDPPYNTGNGDFIYMDKFMDKDDRWKHSRWLTFMEERLTLIRDLLSDDGVLLIHISEEEQAYLTVLADRLFGDLRGPTDLRWGRLGTFTWRTRGGAQDGGTLFSQDSEYILCYAGPGFVFQGLEKDEDLYSNPDNDHRGAWKSDNLSCPDTSLTGPNLYYPIQNPSTGFWYPANPDAVWRFASEERLKKDQKTRSDTMEERIRDGRILWPTNDKSVTYATKQDLLNALALGKGPNTRRGTPILRPDLPDLDFWVGKPIGMGRPQQKSFMANLKRDSKPVSSWIRSSIDVSAILSAAKRSVLPEEGEETEYQDACETGDNAAENPANPSVPRVRGFGIPGQAKVLPYLRDKGLVAGQNQEGTQLIKEILHELPKAFNYPKPLSVTQALVTQITRPYGNPVTGEPDIVLDCFGGSGTTGHAVLAQNAADGGNRQFILMSSTEATLETPEKNVCRTVTRERLRRVSEGYTNAKKLAVLGLGGGAAYLVATRANRLTLRPKGTEGWLWTAIQMSAGFSPTGLTDAAERVAIRRLSNGESVAWVRSWTGASHADLEVVRALGQQGPVVCWTTLPDPVNQAVLDSPYSIIVRHLMPDLPGFGMNRPVTGAVMASMMAAGKTSGDVKPVGETSTPAAQVSETPTGGPSLTEEASQMAEFKIEATSGEIPERLTEMTLEVAVPTAAKKKSHRKRKLSSQSDGTGTATHLDEQLELLR